MTPQSENDKLLLKIAQQAQEIDNLKATQGYNAKFSQVLAEQAQELERLKVDAQLGRDLCAILQNHVGETGLSEGAVEVLKRKLQQLAGTERERDAAVSVCDDFKRGFGEARQQLAAMTAERDKEWADSLVNAIPGLCFVKADSPKEFVKVALATLQATLAEREAELEKHKAMLKYSIEDECDAEQLLVAAGISDYEEGEHGEYRGLHTQIELCIKQRDTARQDAARLRGILQAILNADERGQGLPFQEAMQEAQRALKGGR